MLGGYCCDASCCGARKGGWFVFVGYLFEAYCWPVERRGARAPCYDRVTTGTSCEAEGASCGSRFIGA
jgi:hypothetical protein